MYTVIKKSGSVVATGFTPLKYTGTSGTYSAEIQDYGSYLFQKWATGSTSRVRTETLGGTAVATWTAYFSGSAPAPKPTATLSISAKNQSGATLTGYYTEISTGGTIIQKGYTPLTITGNVGQVYTFTVGDYGGYVFNNWENGSTTRVRSLSLASGGSWPVATYRTTSGGGGGGSTGTKSGLYWALYNYPSSGGLTRWQGIRDAKIRHPSLPFLVAINPNSGPGSSKDSNFATWIANLRNVGCKVIGYKADNYGGTPYSEMQDAANKYKNWYNCDGIFVDEMSTSSGLIARYRDLTNYCHSIGMNTTMGNPGTDVTPAHVDNHCFDTYNTRESPAYYNLTSLLGTNQWHLNYDKKNFVVMQYAASWLDTNWVKEAAKHHGYVTVTTGTNATGRWFDLPSYLETLLGVLETT